LRRYTSTIVLALDADAAGQAATLRGLSQAREALDREWVPVLTASGLVRHEARLAVDLRVMTLPEGKDPDDVVRADANQWRELVNNAQPVVDYYFELARSELDLNTAQGKSEAVERLAPLIAEVADEVKRAHYAQQLARLIQTDERTLERLLLKQRRTATPPPRPRPAEPPPAVWEDAAEDEYPDLPVAMPPKAARPKAAQQRSNQISPATHCLSLLVLHPHLLPDLQAELAVLGIGPLDEDDFGQASERAVCAALVAGELDDSRWPDDNSPDAALLGQLRALARRLPPLPQEQILEDLLRAVLRLRISNLKTQARTLPALTHSAADDGQPEDIRAFLKQQQTLSEHRRLLEQLLNQRSHAGRRQATTVL
jgi:DNA primase